jgi:hypothetical protein
MWISIGSSSLVRRGKGDKDRPVPLPRLVRERLVGHLDEVRRLHASDLAAGHGVVLPDAMAKKYPQTRRRVGRGSSCFRGGSAATREVGRTDAVPAARDR